ncbi:unnamed protein product [Fusarium equiseti]|uniref:Uncharacterized protein n=1 Tax=Fusarium equiseti TaxID=61235 RepID=A0A8J2NAB8_FUSEQ|nr:unnamed protein product [Fusarium equiseti]
MPKIPGKSSLKATAKKTSRYVKVLKQTVKLTVANNREKKAEEKVKKEPSYQLQDTMAPDGEAEEEESWNIIYHEDAANGSSRVEDRDTVEEIEMAAHLSLIHITLQQAEKNSCPKAAVYLHTWLRLVSFTRSPKNKKIFTTKATHSSSQATMALITWRNDSDASSISSDDTIDTSSTFSFQEIHNNEPASPFELEMPTAIDSSFSFTPPATPSTITDLSAQERWEDLVATYRQAVNHVRRIEDEMVDLRYKSFRPDINLDNDDRRIYQKSRPQSLFSITDDMAPTFRMWEGTHVSPNLVQGANHLKLELNEAVELSVVTLDTLSGKKTMISLTTRSSGADIKQLLGFWEFGLSIDV